MHCIMCVHVCDVNVCVRMVWMDVDWMHLREDTATPISRPDLWLCLAGGLHWLQCSQLSHPSFSQSVNLLQEATHSAQPHVHINSQHTHTHTTKTGSKYLLQIPSVSSLYKYCLMHSWLGRRCREQGWGRAR